MTGLNFRAVRKGIFSVGNCDISNPNQPVVVVHPHYNLQKLTPEYLARLDDFMKSHQGPVIIMESQNKLGETIRWANSLRGSDTYVIPTINGCREPSMIAPSPKTRLLVDMEESWRGFSDFVKGFKGRPVGLVGGYFTRDYEMMPGCADTVYFELLDREIDVKPLEGLTFR